MKIQIDARAFHDTKFYEYAVRFFFGAAVTVLAGLIAEKCGPTVGGLFLEFPAICPASATLMEKHQKEKNFAPVAISARAVETPLRSTSPVQSWAASVYWYLRC
jgi:hypothetical protein